MDELTASLDRISIRLQGTNDDQLSGVLNNLMPRLIPMANDDKIRKKAVELITECLRRVKLSGCKLKLSALTTSLQVSFLPFACNLGIAFLDGVSDAGCIDSVEIEAVAQLLGAISTYAVFSYQSNALLYYALLYSESTLEALKQLVNTTEVLATVDIIEDYLLDILLLQTLNVVAGPGFVQSGLSENRMSRINLKKKQLQVIGLPKAKISILNIMVKASISSTLSLLSAKFIIFAMAIGRHDADLDVISRSIFVQNYFRESAEIIWSSPKIVDWLLSQTFSNYSGCIQNIHCDRVSMKIEIQVTVLEEIHQHWKYIARPPYHTIVQLYYQLVSSMSISLMSGYQSKLVCALSHIVADIAREALRPEVNCEVNQMIGAIWILLKQFTSSTQTSLSTNNDESGVKLRIACYEVLEVLMQHKIDQLHNNEELLLQLLVLADQDQQSASTQLFKLLSDYREICSISEASASPEYHNLLANQLERMSNSQRASSKLLYLQWVRHFYGWKKPTIHGMIRLIGKTYKAC